MTRDNLKLLRQWTPRPDEAFVRNLRLRALPSPNLALACRVAAEMPPDRKGPHSRRSARLAQPLMMLCTVETCGWPGSAPSSAMIGSSVAPNASNDSWESQTSNT